MRTAITIDCQTDYNPFNDMAFSANWHDDTHRYHVWIGLRPHLDGERVPYPVKIGATIYKNRIVSERHAPTMRLDINAAANARVKEEIKRLATYDALMSLYNARRAEIEAFDTMRAEADRLNAIFNALKLLETADADELNMMRRIAKIKA